MNKYAEYSKTDKSRRPPAPVWMACESECCDGSQVPHDFNRVADDGREMFTCRNCGEERSAS